jgi:hypothetical protein
MRISIDSRTATVEGDKSITTSNLLHRPSEGVVNTQLTGASISAIKDRNHAEKRDIFEIELNYLAMAIDESALTLKDADNVTKSAIIIAKSNGGSLSDLGEHSIRVHTPTLIVQ